MNHWLVLGSLKKIKEPRSSVTLSISVSLVQAYNNVALLFLEKPFVFRGAPHIGVACLGKRLPEPGTECVTMGWGKEFKGTYASTLKRVSCLKNTTIQYRNLNLIFRISKWPF